MSAAKSGEPPSQDLFLGFHSYADDTPREPGAPAPPADAAYPSRDELSVAPPPEPPTEAYEWDLPDRRPHRRRGSWPMAAGISILALALAAGAGLTRWSPGVRPAPTAPSQPATAPAQESAAGPPAKRTAALSVPAPEPEPEPAPKAQMAAAAPVPHPAAARSPPGTDASEDMLSRILRDLPTQPDAAAPSRLPAAASASDRATDAAVEPPPSRQRMSFDCRGVRSYAQEVVCEDAGLSAQDRRMSQAYAAALAAGVPQSELRAEQGDWLRLREAAARRSPGVMRDLYEQRIEDLEALAADARR